MAAFLLPLSLWVVGTIFVIFTLFVFVKRRKIQPIRGRSYRFVTASCIGAYVLASHSLLAYSFWDDPDDFPCSVSRFIIDIAHPLLFLPYLFRCYRLYFVFNLNAEKLTTNLQYYKARYRAKESFLLHIFFLCMVPFIVYSALEYCLHVQWTPAPFFGCQEDDNFQASTSLFWLGLFILQALTLLVAVFVLRRIQDEFNINSELKIICLIWGIYTFVTTALELTGAHSVFAYTVLSISRSVLVQIVSCAVPLVQSYLAPPIPIWSTSDTVESLDRLLRDPVGIVYFQKYLVNQFSVENLLFWVEVELFKDLTPLDPEVQVEKVQHILNSYFTPEAKLQLRGIPDEFKVQLLSKANAPHRAMFNAVQQFVFDRMEQEVYPRFRESSVCQELKAELRSQENLYGRLLVSSML
eukprot:GILK01004728.1.p1 GENE.GILK01004728.1~~GILK01004728.1.p1  ORF type:complete len:435 (+),score=25.82 GILK01004728.1:76-1305(+)